MGDHKDSEEVMRLYAREYALFHADIRPLVESIMANVNEATANAPLVSTKAQVEAETGICTLCISVRSNGALLREDSNYQFALSVLSATWRAARKDNRPIARKATCAIVRIAAANPELSGIRPQRRKLLS
ncbi:hypothetical protein COT30_00795 [Candidatus Micrarchaeota archaeon CG08_land_8_20_14_0_20_49_17]|nr:MAG: hypothetical protein AUJ13_01995 [Candidatus Micrarchaeota archaeon CG1_02_49_24]PIU10148.1 MAG: hypothetical protein COT30_00795 [Candidatus Micrarchaeota archaeon CG08_land_8_20_14_0_20_49_17]PIU81163.1 MAG: hypothetical protein COS70_05490 [Candidatus Micrarchaeota archaeon CG06_land_8_20_14_3_00_50_6]PIZ95520.1 MAG: hypothetical protein COX84_04425 [Candidatus Micrarchaeota archaeon CG_4_10_14_0_2_um_filter_49_7]HII53597.1 hypothetical protein [Candidatus Micrarchaeota archaeon]